MNGNVEFLQFLQKARNHMEENNYSSTSVSGYMRTWRSVYNFALSKGIENYSAELAEQYMLEKYNMSIGEDCLDNITLSPYMLQKVRALRALTDFKLHGYIPKITRGEQVEWPSEYEDACLRFLEWKKSAGYNTPTCRSHELNLYHFVCFLHFQNVTFEKLEAENLYEYFKTLSHYSKSTISKIRTTLLHSLRYFFDNGYLDNDISEYLPRVIYYAKAKVDKVWSETDVQKMLSSIDRANPTGKRDYAIMLIAANLGLRTSDILSLCIENFNWSQSCINITQRKTGEPLTLPISEAVGKAVIDYWMNGRPSTVEKELFVSHILPYKKLSKESVYHMFNKYYESSGVIAPANRQHGLHSLRHSLTSRLLENGTPVNIISNILGHINSNSASHYLHIDINKLRQCSLEVPDYE